MLSDGQTATDGERGLGTVCGIVLAGVHPWDRTALDAQVPRPLLPVVHMPLIGYPLRWLHAGGVTNVTVCANSASRLVRECLGDGSRLGLDVHYYEDWTPRGPAGCLHDAGLEQPGDVYVITDGTIIPLVDLPDLLAAHAHSGAAVTVAVDTSNGRGGPGPLEPVGIYVFSREALEQVPVTGYQDIKEVLVPRLRAGGRRVLPYYTELPCPRVTGFESYLQVAGWLLECMPAEPDWPDFVRRGEARVHRTAVISEHALVLGPVLIGPDCTIEAGASIVGPAALASGCTVGRGAGVSRSLLWDACTIGAGAVVDQCVVAHGARVGPGAHCWNQYQAAGHCAGRAVSRAV